MLALGDAISIGPSEVTLILIVPSPASGYHLYTLCLVIIIVFSSQDLLGEVLTTDTGVGVVTEVVVDETAVVVQTRVFLIAQIVIQCHTKACGLCLVLTVDNLGKGIDAEVHILVA